MKKSIISSIALIHFLSATIFLEAQIVDIPDPALRASIRSALGIPDRDITQAAMESLTYLKHVHVRQIFSLQGIETAVNLRVLDLSAYHEDDLTEDEIPSIILSDFSPLSGLSKLEELHLCNNDLTALMLPEGLTGLRVLNLRGNRLNETVLSILSRLPKLERLYLEYNGLSNLVFPKGLIALRQLYLGGNPLNGIDLSILSDFQNLGFLDLVDCGLTELSLTKELPSLKELHLGRNQLNGAGLTRLDNIRNLETLYLNNNQLTDLKLSKELPSLKELHLGNNQFDGVDLTGLTKIRNLEKLYLNNNQLTDLILNTELPILKELHLERNHLNESDLSFLRKLPNLEMVYLGRNGFARLSIPEAANRIRGLFLEGNRLNGSDLTFLLALPNLEFLNLESMEMIELNLPTGLIGLKALYLCGNRLNGVDFSFLSNLPNLADLRLEKNGLTEFNLPRGLSNLRTLNLRQNRLSDLNIPDGLSQLSLFDLGSNSLTSFVLPPDLSNLSSLSLDGNQLSSLAFPKGLSKLKRLGLYGNRLVHLELPDDLFNLTELNVGQNQLTRFVLADGLRLLQTLDLSGNQLVDLVLPENLTDLEDLKLSGNQLESLVLPESLSNLVELSLSGNQLKTMVLPEGLASLRNLDLNGNRLTSVRFSEEIPSLKEIRLSRNGMKEVDLSFLADAPNVEKLDLGGNQLTGIALSDEHRNLQYIELNDNELGESELLFLTRLPNLISLNLHQNKINEIILPNPIVKLQSIDLSENLLNGGDLLFLRDFPNLRYLNLQDNRLTDLTLPEGLSTLRTLIIESGVRGFKPNRNRLVNLSLSGGLSSLETLDLSHHSLTSLVLPEGLGSLETLDLSGNQSLTRLVLPEGLFSLKSLFLNGNQLKNLALPPDLVSLKRLGVERNLLTELVLPPGLSSLEWVDVGDNQLSSVEIPESLSNLRSLYLGNNRLTHLVLPNTLLELRRINLSNNRLSTLELPVRLPNLQVLELGSNQLDRLVVPLDLGNLEWLSLGNNPSTRLTIPRDLEERVRPPVSELRDAGVSVDFYDSYIPVLRVDLGDQSAHPGAPVQWSVEAAGYPELSFQWSFNGDLIPGATSSTYTIQAAYEENGGTYQVLVNNSYGEVASRVASLVILNESVRIVQHPRSRVVNAGENLTLSISATGYPFPTFQWFFNGAVIEGAVDSVLEISDLLPIHEGEYSVMIQNEGGVEIGEPAVVSVHTEAPEITMEPHSLGVFEGTPAVLSVSANGIPAPNYQWMSNGEDIPGANHFQFILSPARVEDSGLYSVRVENFVESVESAPAMLFVDRPPEGGVNADFRPEVNGPVYALTQQADGSIITGGDFARAGGTSQNRVVRLLSGGQLDFSFSLGDDPDSPDAPVRALELDAMGKVLVAGEFTSVDGSDRGPIARLNADGAVDGSFEHESKIEGSLQAILLEDQGTMLVGGKFTSRARRQRKNLLRLDSDGRLHNSLHMPEVGDEDFIYSMLATDDGKILLGGWFEAENSGLIQIHSIGLTDENGFGATVNGKVNSLHRQKNGLILLGGDFTSVNQTPSPGLARIFPDGSLDENFDPGEGPDGPVYAIALDQLGRILVGGDFRRFDGTKRNGLTRLGSEGSLDLSFQTGAGADGPVRALLVRDSDVLVAGEFEDYGGMGFTGLVSVNTERIPVQIHMHRTQDRTELVWPAGTLLRASSLDGPWEEVLGGESPFPLETDNDQMFYRLEISP